MDDMDERNRRIFKNEDFKPQKIWRGVMDHITKTILAEEWKQEDLGSMSQEKSILKKLNLKKEMVRTNAWKLTRMSEVTPQKCSRPVEGLIKLNFDGAFKGNIVNAGIGGIFKDIQGRTCLVYMTYGGVMRNMEAEPMEIRKGMRIVVRIG